LSTSDLLVSVVVSFNRLELLQLTLTSYWATVTMPYRLIVVDNGSDRETTDWLASSTVYDDLILLGENKYPGYAANFGWNRALTEYDPLYLHRSDNDVEYLPGWRDEMVRMFDTHPELGQVGLRTLEEEGPHAAVGGNCVLHRKAWDAGVRYREEPWGAIVHEDGHMSNTVAAAGFAWARVETPCIVHRGIADMTDPYYQETMRIRGITL
jgi:glycosyltransferase involved in cell wall biosynthesis